MSPKSMTSIASALMVLGGAIFGLLGTIHATYTLLDMRNPRRLVPVDPSVAQAMAQTGLRLSRGGTDMWRAWVGFNFSHSLGLLVVSALGIWAGCRIKVLPAGVLMPALALVGCCYEVLALLYWFRIPAIGVAIGTACFAAAWLLTLR